MAVVGLENKALIWSSFVAQFTHRERRGSSSIQKYIVQQFSCHSKHSYLSVNGPVASAAIQIKYNKKTSAATQSKEKGRWPRQWFASVSTLTTHSVYFASQLTGSIRLDYLKQPLVSIHFRTIWKPLSCETHDSLSQSPDESRYLTLSCYISVKNAIW